MFGRSSQQTVPLAPAGGNGQQYGASGAANSASAVPAGAPTSVIPAGPTPAQAPKIEVHRRLLENMDLAHAPRKPPDELQRACAPRISQHLSEHPPHPPAPDRP